MIDVVLVMLIVHTPDGREVRINHEMVTSLQSPKVGARKEDKLFDDDVKCLINLADGKSISIIEPCEVVQKMLERHQ